MLTYEESLNEPPSPASEKKEAIWSCSDVWKVKKRLISVNKRYTVFFQEDTARTDKGQINGRCDKIKLFKKITSLSVDVSTCVYVSGEMRESFHVGVVVRWAWGVTTAGCCSYEWLYEGNESQSRLFTSKAESKGMQQSLTQFCYQRILQRILNEVCIKEKKLTINVAKNEVMTYERMREDTDHGKA